MDLDIVKVVAMVLVPLSMLFLATVIGAFRYFVSEFTADIKRELVSLEGNIDKNSEKVIQLERDFMAFQAQMPKEYVMRVEHIRVTAIFEKKVDRLGDLIMALDGTIQGQQAQMKLLLVRFGDSNAKREK